MAGSNQLCKAKAVNLVFIELEHKRNVAVFNSQQGKVNVYIKWNNWFRNSNHFGFFQ